MTVMRKGFTLLELLVASLLLGMLMTVLTMLFNQSSIAWRTGVAGVNDLDEVRETIGRVRNEADNAYIWKNGSPQVASIVSIWRSDAGGKTGSQKLRRRAIDAGTESDIQQGEKITAILGSLNTGASGAKAGQIVTQSSISCGQGQTGNADNYSVNVRCAGPDGKHNTYDDIWSFPDDFDL